MNPPGGPPIPPLLPPTPPKFIGDALIVLKASSTSPSTVYSNLCAILNPIVQANYCSSGLWHTRVKCETSLIRVLLVEVLNETTSCDEHILSTQAVVRSLYSLSPPRRHIVYQLPSS